MSQSVKTPSLQSMLGSVMWYPGQSQADWQAEMDAAIEASQIVDAFLKDEIEVDSFLDWVDETVANPFCVFEDLPEPENHPWGLILP